MAQPFGFGSGGKTSSVFGEQTSQPSNVFGSFSGQTSQSAGTFGSLSSAQGSQPSGFGSVSGFSGFGTSAQGFGSYSTSSVFGASTPTPLFGGSTNASQTQSFGSLADSTNKSIFGTTSTSGSSGLSTNPFSKSSQQTPTFGSTSNPFGAAPSVTLFSGNTQASSSLFGAGNTSVPSTLFGQVQPARPVTSHGTNVFGTFGTNTSNVLASSSSGFGSAQSAGGVRKRSSTVETAGSSLFGKLSSGAPDQFSTSSTTPQGTSSPLFSAKPEAPFTTSAVFSGPAAAHTGFDFINKTDSTASAGDKTLFGKRQSDGSDSSKKTLFGKTESSTLPGDGKMAFSHIQMSQSPPFPTINTSAKTPSGNTRELPVYDSPFGSPDDDGKESQPSKRSNVLFGKTGTRGPSQTGFALPQQPTSALFKRALLSSSGQSGTDQGAKNSRLFGKPPASTGLHSGMSRTTSSINLVQQEQDESQRGFSPDRPRQAQSEEEMIDENSKDRHVQENRTGDNAAGGSSPRKSLHKWSRGRETSQTERKRKELSTVPESESDRESKKSRLHAEEGTRAVSSPLSRQRSSSLRQTEDLSLKTCIVVKNIPANLNKGPILRKHFSRFGSITRLQPLPNKRAANITFKTHEEAVNAKNEGQHLSLQGPPVHIFLRSTSVNKSPDTKPVRGREDTKRSAAKSSVFNTVDDELASMAGTSDFQEEFRSDRSHSATVSTAVSHQQDVSKRSVARRRSPAPPPQSTISPSSGALDTDVAKGLAKSIWHAKTKDSTEKIAVLDSRDKLLRLLRGRQQGDLATAKAFAGTCPDMCPEKERYYREDIRRLALYEVIPSTMTSVTGQKSKVDHFRAVKEYSRSSADQEEPLPHELRPLPVLVMTMNYLLNEVADQGGEGSWAEWYDFLWNRTRGIRKDITQQQLCDIQVAELLEKCARFHIFCSERLCEEDMMSFDAKINNENLTKCLQTLKELYTDLEKKGLYCPNEAEFRAYMVLMNLNEGDILREIQQLRPEIRDSPHIAFAVKAYHALNANNYVRFFRLIEEEANFLNACALHRYFNQIRSKALLIIMKAHGALGKNRIAYPVQEMIRLLCFEDADKVIEFCDHYCLSVEGVDVILDSKAFLEPEGSLPQQRSQSLVEIKQSVSVGEIINGCPLPPLELPQPSSSFDSEGVFIFSPELQKALASSGLFGSKETVETANSHITQEQVHHRTNQGQARSEQGMYAHAGHRQEISAPALQQHGLPVASKVQREHLIFSNDVVKSLARDVILEVIDNTIKGIANEVVKEEMARDTVIMSEVTSLAEDVVADLSRVVASEVHEEEEAKLRQKLAEEMAAQRQRVFSSLCDGIVDDTVADMSKEIADKEMSLVKAELHRQSQERSTAVLSDEVLDETVSEFIQDVASQVFEVDVVAKRERLEATEQCVEVLRCRRFFHAWRLNYLAKIRVKRAMLDFPSAPTGKSIERQIHSLVPHRPYARIAEKSFFIGERAKLSVESPMDVIQTQLHLSTHLSMASARRMLAGLVLWRPLDMTQVIGPHLQRAFHKWKQEKLIEPDVSSVQWKLSVSLPQHPSDASEEEITFVKWIKAKLCKDSDRETILKEKPPYEGQVLSVYRTKQSSPRENKVSQALCVRCFQGVWTENQELSILKKDILKGTSAVMFVMSPAENLASQNPSAQGLWKRERQRLHQIFKQKQKNPALPLVVIVPRLTPDSNVSAALLDQGLELSSLYEGELLSSVHMAQPFIGAQEQPLEYFEDWTTQLTNCLRFAASRVSTPPKLRTKPVSDFVEDATVEFYKAPVYQDLRTRTRHQMLHQSPNTLLSLYNEVIEHVAMVAASSSVITVSWPAPEFDQNLQPGEAPSSWNTESYLCDLYELVTKLRLPYFRYTDMEADDWSSLCQDIWAYVSSVTKKDSGSAKIFLFQQVTELLSRTKKNFDQFCWLASEDGPCEPSYVNMAWTDLIDACIHYRLVSLRTGHLTMRKPDDEDESEQKEEEFEEVLVYYLEEELDDWEPPASWRDALRDTETAEDGQVKPTVDKAAVKRDETLMEASTKSQESIGSGLSQKDTQDHSSIAVTEQSRSTSPNLIDLKHRLQQEREDSQRYEQVLAAALSSSSSPKEAQAPWPASLISTDVSPIMPPSKHQPPRSPYKRGSGSFLSSERSDQQVSDMSFTGAGAFQTPRRTQVQQTQSPLSMYLRTGRTPEMASGDVASCSKTDESDDFSSLPFSEKVSSLQQMVASQRQADMLFEMRLKSLIQEPLL